MHYWFNIHWFSKFSLKTSCLLTHSCSSWVSPLDTKSWKKSEKIRGLQEMLNLLLDNDLSLTKVKWINTKMKHHTFQQPIRCQCQWLHSSVGRASHQYREVMGSNSIEFQNFLFPGFFTQLHKLHSLRQSFLHFHFISAVISLTQKNYYWEKTLITSLEYINRMHKINDNIGNFIETLHYVFTIK